jgi:acetyl-CoA carboxylase biotin carboxyl carrier protein
MDGTDIEQLELDATRPGTGGSLITVACESMWRLISASDRPLRRAVIRAGGVSVELEWPEATGQPAQPAPPQVAPLNGAARAEARPGPHAHQVCSAMVGVFYRCPEPGAEPFVREGDLVRAGQQVAIIEAMKLMTPVHADRGGRVEEILVADGQPVEFGTALIALAEDGPR